MEEERCGLCETTLDEACKRWDGEFCGLRADYAAGNLDQEQVILELTARITPEQKRELAAATEARILAHAKT